MADILITNARVWDASGAAAYDGEVLISGERIKAVSKGAGNIPVEGCKVIDAKGQTLIPGLVEGHMHMTFDNITKGDDLTLLPPEEHVLVTLRQAKVMIDQGFTSCYSGASSKIRTEVVVRNEINAGHFPGPRFRACSPEITVTAGLGDENLLHFPRGSFALVADGVDEITKTVRVCVREGNDNIKLNVSGDPFSPGSPASATPMTQAEVDAAVGVAHDFGRAINAHARSTESMKRALRGGVDVLYHCEYADEEALDMLEAAKDRIFVAPTVSLFHTSLYEGDDHGMPGEVAAAMGMEQLLEWSQKTHTELRKRGIRHVIGGDYGFAWSNHGTNARDIEFFCKYYGYSPAEALECATRNGGAQMMIGRDDKLGEIKVGFLADLLLVNGDPLADAKLVTDAAKLSLIMKGGDVYKNAL